MDAMRMRSPIEFFPPPANRAILFCLLIVMIFCGSLASQEPENPLYIFDLETYLAQKPDNKAWQYDVINLVSALQGLVNRDKPRLYVLYVREGLSYHQINVDRFWLGKLRTPGGFLADYTLVDVPSVENLLEIFQTDYTAVVSWDPQAPATGNVALTIAGVDGFLPIRFDQSRDSLYTQIVDGGPRLIPGEQLRGKFNGVGRIIDTNIPTTQLPKNDAYLWAKTLYLDQNMCSNTYLGFFLDPFDWDAAAPGFQYPDLFNCMITNHDFYVGKQAFFLDLDPWLDEIPTDTPNNPFNTGKDKETLLAILESAFQNTKGSERILRVGGFVPWRKKYSSHSEVNTPVVGKHPPAETAHEFISIVSAFNGVIDADDSPYGALANASVYQHAPLKQRYFQNPIPAQRPLENKNYLLFVIGDFRSSAMLYQTLPIQWEDQARGLIPITWSISPLLSERVPHIFDYLYSTKTPNDYFTAGNTGPGLCYPNRYIPNRKHSRLGDGLAYWEKLARDSYRRFDLQITVAADLDRELFGQTLVSGQPDVNPVLFDERLQSAFFLFSPHGVSSLKPFYTPLGRQIVPFLRETANFMQRALPIDTIVQRIYQESDARGRKFHVYRFNQATPQFLVYLSERIKKERADLRFELLDPYSFFYLLRQHYANGDPSVNYLLPNFIAHTIPLEIKPGKEGARQCEITLRNDGWDIWNPLEIPPNQRYRLKYHWEYVDDGSMISGKHDAYVNGPVLPGEQTSLKILIEAPEKTGLYDLTLHFEKAGYRGSALEEKVKVVVY
jgi:hypothetical protein